MRNDTICRSVGVLASFGVVVALSACAPTEKPKFDTGPQSEYGHLRTYKPAVDEKGYEVRPELKPAQVLPPEMVKGKNFEVVGDVQSYGFTNEYQLQSDFGTYDVHGTGLLRKRIHEIEIMAALKEYEVTNEKVYALAAANAAEGPLEGAMQLITNPVETLSGIPKGMYAYGQTIVEMTDGDRTYLEDSYSDELIGFSTAKRSWAYRLGVDPYSSNPELQKTLNRYAWLSFAGGLTVRLPMMAVSGGAGMALTVVQTADDMKRTIHDLPPEQIRIRNREKLLAMGVPKDLTERFVGHQFYSPTKQLIITESLDALKNAKGREKFIELALLADNPDETWFGTRMALLLMIYHNNVNPIAEIITTNGLLKAYTVNRDIVVPFYLDYGIWSPRGEKVYEAVDKSLPNDRQINGKIFFVSGVVSPRAKEKLAKRDWQVMDEIEQKALKAYDEKHSEPGKADPTRVLPEIGS